MMIYPRNAWRPSRPLETPMVGSKPKRLYNGETTDTNGKREERGEGTSDPRNPRGPPTVYAYGVFSSSSSRATASAPSKEGEFIHHTTGVRREGGTRRRVW